MDTITATALKAKLDNGESPVLLDVRETWEYDLCHIENSINISMANVDKMLQELNHDAETVVICHHGMRSFQVANHLMSNGFNHIANLEGGIDHWAKTIAPDMTQY